MQKRSICYVIEVIGLKLIVKLCFTLLWISSYYIRTCFIFAWMGLFSSHLSFINLHILHIPTLPPSPFFIGHHWWIQEMAKGTCTPIWSLCMYNLPYFLCVHPAFYVSVSLPFLLCAFPFSRPPLLTTDGALVWAILSPCQSKFSTCFICDNLHTIWPISVLICLYKNTSLSRRDIVNPCKNLFFLMEVKFQIFVYGKYTK